MSNVKPYAPGQHFIAPRGIRRMDEFPYRPLDTATVASLRADIEANGLLNNIVVFNGGGTGELVESKKGLVPAAFLVAGNHRLEALKGFAKADPAAFAKKFPNGIPCLVLGGTVKSAITAMLRENVQRKDASFGDLLPAIEVLMAEPHKMSQVKVAEAVGKSQSYISQILKVKAEAGEEATKELVKSGVSFNQSRKAAKTIAADRKAGKPVDAKAVVEKLKANKAKVGKTGKPAREERRVGAATVLSRVEALPRMAAKDLNAVLISALQYLAKKSDALPPELNEPEGDEAE